MNRHRTQIQKRTLLKLHPIASHVVLTSRHALSPLTRKRIIRSGTVAASLVAAVGLTTVFAAAQQNPERSRPLEMPHADIHALVQATTNTPAAQSGSPNTQPQSSSTSNQQRASSSVVINGQQVQTGNGTVQKTITDENGTTHVTVTIDNSPATTDDSSSNSSINVDTHSDSYSNSFTLNSTTRGP